MRYPPPPWRLAGPCAVVTGLIPVADVRDRVPADLDIVAVRPGRTVASIIVADYRDRATFPYAELAVMAAIVRYRGVRGPWISDIWVDSQASLEGGRQMWGLAKEHADFTWTSGPDVAVTVATDEQTLGTWSWPNPTRRFPYPGWFRGIGSVDGDRRRYRGRGVARLARTPVSFHAPDDSPLTAVHRSLQRPVWMAGDLNISFGDIRILAPPLHHAARPDQSAGRST